MAKEAVAQQRQNHFILLILTDGYPSLNHHDDHQQPLRGPLFAAPSPDRWCVCVSTPRSIISDMRETTREIVRASTLPLSIGTCVVYCVVCVVCVALV